MPCPIVASGRHMYIDVFATAKAPLACLEISPSMSRSGREMVTASRRAGENPTGDADDTTLHCLTQRSETDCFLPAHRLERVIRDLVAIKDHERVGQVIDQLCNDYAYAVHQPHARNGGLIGLAAAAIALGSVSHLVPAQPASAL